MESEVKNKHQSLKQATPFHESVENVHYFHTLGKDEKSNYSHILGIYYYIVQKSTRIQNKNDN